MCGSSRGDVRCIRRWVRTHIVHILLLLRKYCIINHYFYSLLFINFKSWAGNDLFVGDYVLSLSSSDVTHDVLEYREEIICLPPDHEYFPYACGGYYSSEVSWAIYKGTDLIEENKVAMGSAKEVCSDDLEGLYGSFHTAPSQPLSQASPGQKLQYDNVVNDVGSSHFGSLSTRSFYESAQLADRAVRDILTRMRHVLGHEELSTLEVGEVERHAKAGAERKQYRLLQVKHDFILFISLLNMY